MERRSVAFGKIITTRQAHQVSAWRICRTHSDLVCQLQSGSFSERVNMTCAVLVDWSCVAQAYMRPVALEIADGDHQLHHTDPGRTLAVSQHTSRHQRSGQCAAPTFSRQTVSITMCETTSEYRRRSSHDEPFTPTSIARWNLSRSFRGCMELPVMREYTR
jgi:hypothetical protein